MLPKYVSDVEEHARGLLTAPMLAVMDSEMSAGLSDDRGVMVKRVTMTTMVITVLLQCSRLLKIAMTTIVMMMSSKYLCDLTLL
jgi:hypothetical protein